MQIRQTVLSESISVSYLSWTNNLKADYLLHKNKRTARGNKKKFLFPYLGSTLLGLPRIACRPVARCTAAVAYTSTSVMFTGGMGTRSNGYGLLHQYWVNVKRIDIPRTDRPESARKSRMRHHIGPHVVVSSGSLQRIYLHCTNLF